MAGALNRTEWTQLTRDVLAAAQLGEETVLAALDPLLELPSLESARAQRDLARLGRLLGETATSSLLETLAGHPQPSLRYLAAWALPASWTSASPEVVEALASDRSAAIREGLRRALLELPADLRWPLVRAWIGSQRPRLEQLAVALVPPQPAAEALAALKGPAAAPDPDLRAGALESLQRIAEVDPAATLGALRSWATLQGAPACWTVARALSRPPLVHRLEAAMGILGSLAQNGQGDRVCAHQLVVALRALARRHGAPTVREALRGWQGSPEPGLRRLAQRAVARLPEA